MSKAVSQRSCSLSWTAALGAALCLFGTVPALAIPSPELVVGSISSISQVVGLLIAMAGGGAAFAGVRAASGRRGGGKLWAVVIGVTILLLTGSIGVNYWQYTTYEKAKQDRLEATLIRPTPLGPDGKPLDDAIREPKWEEQLTAPNRMSTDEVVEFMKAKERGEYADTDFYDIRETVELEMGTPPGAKPLRFADISAGRVKLDPTRKAVLVCHTGIRSYDMCQRFKAMGIDCRFMTGGIEKYLTERKPLTGKRIRTLKDLRALPAYPGQTVLLDTPDVRELVEKEGAIFVDPRLAGEFRYSHIPGSYNFSLRQTPEDQIAKKVAEIPFKPIIIPCNDRRSCFYGEALGLQLSRGGHDVRGRYTVPWDYFVKTPTRPFIQKWLDELNQTWWDKAVIFVATGLRPVADHAGLLIAILLLAAVSRLLVLPVSVKAERDQIASRDLEPELASIKAKYADDPRRLTREMKAFYRRNGLTPVRNMFGLAFLPVMALGVAAVQMVAGETSQGLFWIANSADRDPAFVLPVLFAALVCVYLDAVFVRTGKHRALVWGLGMPAFIATGALLSAAADAYVIVSVVLLLAQRALVTGQIGRLSRAWREWRRDGELVPLADVEMLSKCGNKAFRLGQMRAAGIDVPDGLVLTARFLERFPRSTPDQRQRELGRIWRRVGADRVAVRSSAAAEDGSVHSFAGVFDSLLNVERAQFEAAIGKVVASFDSERAKSYGAAAGANNILVQRMVDAEFAGVLFTHDPASESLSLIELVRGTADKLVTGLVPPDAFRFGRLSGRLVGDRQPPIDLGPLVEIGRRVEALFGAPQDIEWTYAGGRFFLVQSRDISRVMKKETDAPAIREEWRRVLDLAAGASPDATVFVQNEMSEVLPRPTPLSLSLVQSLWAGGGSVDQACAALNLPYPVDERAPDYAVALFGRLYVDARQNAARALRLTAPGLRRLRNSAAAIETAFREQFLPEFEGEMALLAATDFDKLSTGELIAAVQRIRSNFLRRTHVEVSIVNIAANLFLQDAKQKLAADRLDPLSFLTPTELNEFQRITSAAAGLPQADRKAALEKGIGHRATLDYELSQPRYIEAPAELNAVAAIPAPAFKAAEADAGVKMSEETLRSVRLARRYEVLKEDAKHYALREIAALRRAVLALDRRLRFDGLIFHLTFDEVARLGGEAETLRAVAGERKARAAAFDQVAPLPVKLTLAELENAAAGLAASGPADGQVRGTRVSGTGTVEGRACVVQASDAEAGADIPGFRDGDIVVSKMVSPAWIPYFSRAGGFVCEVGGWLSHTAIVARESNVPLIVNAEGLTTIADDMRLRLHPSGVVEIVGADAMAEAAE